MNYSSPLSIDTIAGYLNEKEVLLDIETQDHQQFIRMKWGFEIGDAIVIISVYETQSSNGHAHKSHTAATCRLEITCVTQQQYNANRQAVLEFLNSRNRERAFNRSLDEDGNVWLEYVGFYPNLMPFPKELFEAIFDGVMLHFQDDYQALENARDAGDGTSSNDTSSNDTSSNDTSSNGTGDNGQRDESTDGDGQDRGAAE